MEDVKTLDGQNAIDSNESHSDSPSPSEEYLKPWMRQLGKEYFKNEELAKFDSLSSALDSLLARPEKKDVPSEYGLREGTDSIFSKAGLTKEEASEIDGFYSKLIPEPKVDPDLKETFGESYEKTMEYYANAEKTFSELKDSIEKEGLNKNPTFVKIMSMVGRETRGQAFVPPKDSPKDSSYAALYAQSIMRQINR